MRVCAVCGKDISKRHPSALTCSKKCGYKRTYRIRRSDPEKVQKERDYMRKYMREYLSDEGNKQRHYEAVRKYQSSEKGQASIKRARENARRKKNERNNR